MYFEKEKNGGGNTIKLSSFFGTRTLVRAESGKTIATAGTEVPVPRKH